MFQALGMQGAGAAPALPRNQHLSVASAMSARASVSSAGPIVIKRRAVEEADVQQKVIEEKLRKEGLPPTGYEFKELIGKGAYGRVYKSLNKKSGEVVAVKVLETDTMDWETTGPNKDGSMDNALKEINILQRLQQARASNVNIFYEAFQVHSQLWIVSQYCPGGSITTLRRATGNKLEEKHIIPIARELAKGLKSVHEAGIIHRDVKCSNVMISEKGDVQIIDFGVAGVLMSNLDDDKRKTIIGTPHWMAPEMQKNAAEIAHGTEVDCWAYGITLYECAMGAPPNARVMPGRQLQSKIRQEPAPRLPSGRYSKELGDLVAFVLEPDPKKRPTMDRICQHPYIKDTDDQYPTSSLAELVQKFYFWEHSGGSRASLFIEGGAAKPSLEPANKEEDEEWNFSTTREFEKKQQKEIIRLSMMDPNSNLDPSQFADMLANSPPTEADEFEPFDQPTATLFATDATKGSDGVDNETRVARGARAMQGLFDETVEPYKYGYSAGDLPLRSGEGSDSLHRKEVSVGSSSGKPQIDISDAPKGRSNRTTMGWKWNENLGDARPSDIASLATATISAPRPTLKQSATEPPLGKDRPMSETLDLDAMMGEDSLTLDSTTTLWGGTSNITSSAASVVGGDEETEDDGIIDLDIGDTMKPGYYAMGPNIMLHTKKESDSSLSLPPPSATSTLVNNPHFPTGTTVAATPGYTSSMAPLRADYRPSGVDFPWPSPPNPAALVNGAPPNVMLDALEHGLENWVAALEALNVKFKQLASSEDEGDDASQGSLAPKQTRGMHSSQQASISSLGGFSGPGEDVGEHIEGDDSVGFGTQDGDEEHDADVEGDSTTAGNRRW